MSQERKAWALAYAKRLGWRIVPIHTPTDSGCSCRLKECTSPGKHPRLMNWPTEASADPEWVKKMWTRWPEANVGIACGQTSGVVVLDVDGEIGLQELRRLEAEHGELPETLVSLTGGGGMHYFFRYPEGGLGNPVGFAPGLDCRADGGQVVAPPSLHASGRQYEFEAAGYPGEVEVAAMPEWLVGLIRGKAKGRSAPGTALGPPRAPLQKGDGRNDYLFRFACSLKARGLPWDFLEATVVSTNLNPAVIADPLPDDELTKLLDSVQRYPDPDEQPVPGPESLPEAQDHDSNVPEVGDRTTRAVQKLNETNFIALHGGTTLVFRRQADTEARDDEPLTLRWTPYKPGDWSAFHAHRAMVWGEYKNGDPKFAKLGKVWLEHPKQRRYEGLVYVPGQPREIGQRYNLWEGFTCEPEEGDGHAKWLDHALENICSGDEKAFDYLMQLMAQLVQDPGSTWGVAVILRGGQGTGKGSFVQPILDICGPHGMHVHKQEYFTSRFNGHLQAKSFLFVDEGYWSGGKSDLGTLKGLITDPTITVEAKYQSPVQIRNTLHVFMASNEDWVVPAGPSERRFFVLDVADHKAQDNRYFGAMRRAMRDGGNAHLLHYLLEMDLTDFEAMRPPKTQALTLQRGLSLEPIEQWWHELLKDAEYPIYGPNMYHEQVIVRRQWNGSAVEVGKRILRDDYREWCSRTGHRERRDVSTIIGILLQKVMPDGYPQEVGRRPATRYQFPSIELAREAWAAHQGSAWIW